MSKEKKTRAQKRLEKRERAIRPFISAWGYVGYSVLWCIPVLGWLIWFFNLFSRKTNKRSYARSKLCVAIVLLILCALLFAALFVAVAFGLSPVLTEFCMDNGIFTKIIEARAA